MRHVGVSVDVDAPVEAVWELLTKVDRWPEWGTTVRRVESTADRIDVGTSGRVQTIAGFWLPFTVTEMVPLSSWRWRVAGLPATRHYIAATSPSGCRVRFTVAWMLAPYLLPMWLSLLRLKRSAEGRARLG